MGTYVQYGCGITAPPGWLHFDASPTLFLQRLPVIGARLAPRMHVVFPENVRFGDILSGLPGVEEGSATGLFCSHVLEHLSLEDLRVALRRSRALLAPGGTFRLVLPDLEVAARRYVASLDAGDASASVLFMGDATLVGTVKRPRGLRERLVASLGNSPHLWMWDERSLTRELHEAGFSTVRRAAFGDATDRQFDAVEHPDRFRDALALECRP